MTNSIAGAPGRASAVIVAVAAAWGLYWLPLRQIDGLGPWATVLALSVAVAILLPFGWRGWARLRATPMRVLAGLWGGGAAFVLYSNGLVYGQVAVVILLFYLTPVWSTLIAQFWLGRRVSRWRYAAIIGGGIGIVLVLRGAHGGLPLPHKLGDWLGLASGLFWAIAATGIHGHAGTRPAEMNFVFCLGGLLAAIVLAPLLAGSALADSAEVIDAATLGWIAVIGLGWWALSLTAFVTATQVVEPPRVGILMMSEVIVGVVSAAILAEEPFGPAMAAGTVLIVGAGVLDSVAERAKL